MGVDRFKNQNYKKLRKNCVETKELFEDPLFPANEGSLNLPPSHRSLQSSIAWKRPSELCKDPRLFVEKACSKDVTQGRLGNCWFVAACSALATVKPLWSQVVPKYKLQEWDESNPDQYAGIFRFRFWRFGKWIEVVVDDYLPTINNQLLFCHSTTENEFWSALLEKAYAKLCGSYGAMDGGNLCDALVDFTSGLSEIIELKDYKQDEDKKNELRKQLLKKHEEHALMCCAISPSDSSEFEARTRTGLVKGHAYGITSVKDINLGSTGLLSLFKSGEKMTMVRLRNPWGAKEWNGAFSDGGRGDAQAVKSNSNNHNCAFRPSSSCYATSSFVYSVEQLLGMNSRSAEWSKISKSEKEKLGLTFEDDGEFWMPYEDFVAEFTDLSICHLINTSVFSWWKRWYDMSVLGQWTKPNNAGGCPNHDTFLKNPQYCFDVPREDMEIIVHLIQTDTRGQNPFPDGKSTDYESIGFHVMKVEENRKYRVHKLKRRAVTSDYVKSRSVFFRGRINGRGRHVLLPTTFRPDIETEFMLRIFTEDKIQLKELTKDHPEPMWLCAPFSSTPMCVTNITVEGASGLAQSENTYCIVKVEGAKLKSEVIVNSQEPQFNLSGIFFRYDVCKPIIVELWESKLFRDRFLGCAVVTGAADNQILSIKSQLVGRGRLQSEQHPGELKIVHVTYDNLNA